MNYNNFKVDVDLEIDPFDKLYYFKYSIIKLYIKILYTIKYNPELFQLKLEKLHKMIIKNPIYEILLDSETKYFFEFACICGFWPKNENIVFSLHIHYLLTYPENSKDINEIFSYLRHFTNKNKYSVDNLI